MSESNESNLRALKRLVREPWDDVIEDAIKTEARCSAALARIAELEAENARLKVIETAIKNVMRLRMVQLPRGPHCSAECLGTCEHCLALHELKTALAVKEQA